MVAREPVRVGPPGDGFRSEDDERRFPGVGGAVLLFALYLLLQILAYALVGDLEEGHSMVLAWLGGVLLPMALTAWIGVRLCRVPFHELLGPLEVPVRAFPPLLLLLLGFWILLFEASGRVTDAVPMPEQLMQNLVMLLGDAPLPAMLGIMLIVVFFEELLFRGVILAGLLERYGVLPAITLSTLFFALWHLNPWQAPAALGLGLLLGWLYVRTRSVMLCFAVHGAHNLLVGYASARIAYLAGVPAEMLAGEAAPLPLAWLLLGALPVIVGFILADRMLRAEPRDTATEPLAHETTGR